MKKTLGPIIVCVLLFQSAIAQGYVKPEFSWPQRGASSTHSANANWEIGENVSCENPMVLKEMVHGAATWGDLIYLTGTNGSLFCVTKNGELVFAERVPEKPIGVPLIDDAGAYVFTQSGILMKFDRVSGEKLWESKVSNKGITDIARYGNYVVFGSEKSLHCINITNGIRLWNISLPSNPQPVAISSFRVLVNYTSGLRCVSLLNGKTLWEEQIKQTSIDETSFTGTPTIHFNMVYIGLSDGRLQSFNLYNGNMIWEAKKGFSQANPTASGNRLWLPSGDKVVCLSAKTGAVVWEKKVADWVIWSQVVKSKNFIIAACQCEKVYLVNPDTGETVKTFDIEKQSTQDIAVGTDYFVVIDNSKFLYIFK